MTRTRCRRRHSAAAFDAGMARLVRLVLEGDWSSEDAAHRLVAVVDDPEVLERMALTVRRADQASSSKVTARAVATVETAMDQVRSPGPRQTATVG